MLTDVGGSMSMTSQMLRKAVNEARAERARARQVRERAVETVARRADDPNDSRQTPAGLAGSDRRWSA
jgi:hypothetical protein